MMVHNVELRPPEEAEKCNRYETKGKSVFIDKRIGTKSGEIHFRLRKLFFIKTIEASGYEYKVV